jgi:hypothetical protein
VTLRLLPSLKSQIFVLAIFDRVDPRPHQTLLSWIVTKLEERKKVKGA